ncbi:MAG: DUF4329 domain-containing protein [Gammaproteobacteria bacterium]|jgi:hypothetical protein|nr:DUF4329 domain-containing protein [Gammaproteobacteria bacterium]MBT7370433.1 DUF4329 domain-containing protein [Gammaproteobacteria bacterium]
MKSVIILLMAICSIRATLANCPHQGYPSASVAAAVAGSIYYKRSAREDREFMGGILESKGKFSFTVSEGNAGEDEVTAKIPVPQGSRLSGLWHTHGSPHYSRKYFSDLDTQLAKTLGVPFYLTDAVGHHRVYVPDAPTLTGLQARKLGLGHHHGYAKGARVKDRVHC